MAQMIARRLTADIAAAVAWLADDECFMHGRSTSL
jgi:hypothetical protein